MNNIKTIAHTEIVEIIQEIDAKTNGSWQPIEGEVTKSLGNQISPSHISEPEWKMIKDEAIFALAECVPPTAEPRRETGLVVGYVQSGKTYSFTTVAALARDNGYQMIIVIAGTSINLLEQSTRRLEDDLELLAQSGKKWHHFKSSEFNEGDRTEIEDILAGWQDPTVPEPKCQTVLITAMKQHQHLKKLVHVLKRLNLSNVPALIIDDEADQASLNTKVQKRETSTTYECILSLRKYLPHHTFLQYTATPQAPLLINIIDVLSPNFAKVLTPGAGYTGGEAFFCAEPNRVCTIPDNEIPTKENSLDAPPESLLEAMRIFLLGVTAAVIIEGGHPKGNRSMMVHPSTETLRHGQYYRWVERVKNYWREVFNPAENHPARLDLLEDFRNSYESLQKTVPDLPSFEMLSTRLLQGLRKVRPYEVNTTSGPTPQIPWRRVYAPILVGGLALDRGFTVEGLTVTYMPRGTGSGNADTIQQRARFFGYKQSYFGYCRVFLEEGVRDAYERYIIHEEDVHKRLRDHDKTDKPLNEWKREFFLDRTLNPTRQNILNIGYSQRNLGNQWYVLKAPHDPIDAIITNRFIVKEFLSKLLFRDDEGHPKRTEMQKHHEADYPLEDVYKELLVPFQVTQLTESQELMQVVSQIAVYLVSNPKASCKIYHMSKGNLRNRSLNDNNQLRGIFQGQSVDRVTYLGDRERKISECVTVQIHNFRILQEKRVICSDVPVLTVWLPKDISPDLLVQNQGRIEIGH